MSNAQLGVLIMAAGESRRFDGCKLLADLHGKPLIQYVLDRSAQLLATKRIVVSGRWYEALDLAKRRGAFSECDLVFNPTWSEGLGSSISFGVKHLADQCDAILILLADQVALELSDLKDLIDRSSEHQIACAKYNGTRGVPAVFSKSMFPYLLDLSGEKGAKALLVSEEFDVVELDMPSAAIDIDTRRQLEAQNQKGPCFP